MVSTKLSPWRLAVKPGSLPKIIAPTAVGLCMGIGAVGAVPPLALFVLAFVIALCAQWSIVLLNDYADLEADAAHQQRFPELIDLRVLVEGLLTPGQVLGAGLLAALGARLRLTLLATGVQGSRLRSGTATVASDVSSGRSTTLGPHFTGWFTRRGRRVAPAHHRDGVLAEAPV